MGSCGVVAAVAVEFNRLKKGGSMRHKQSVQIGHATRRAWTRGAVVVAALTLAAGAQAVDFPTAGTYTYTVPAGVTSITVRVVGGGGGGGGYGGDRPQRQPAQRREPAQAKPANFDDVPFDDDIPF